MNNKFEVQTLEIDIPDYELILTPDEMAEFQKDIKIGNNWFETDKYLVQALKSVSLIEGSQNLLDIYRRKVEEAINIDVMKNRALRMLQEDLSKFSLKFDVSEGGKMLSAKEFIASAIELSLH